MGLWNWVWDRLTGSAGESQVDVDEARSTSDRIGLAVLEAPVHQRTPATHAILEDDPVDPWWAPEDATLVRPVVPARPELSPEARALEIVLISHLDGHDLAVPPLPHVPQVVLGRLRDRACSFDKVAADIAQDQIVAAAVLRLANSPFYRGLDKITQLTPAVSRLGAKAMRTLMMHESLHAAVFQSKGSDTELARVVWERALAGAWIMRNLAELVGLDLEDAFLMGLLHDIGNVMVLRQAAAARTTAHYRIDLETFDYLCHKFHQRFGKLIAESWKLPTDLAKVIADHHAAPADDDPLRTHRWALQLSDLIAAQLGYGPPATYNLLETAPAHELGLSESGAFIACLTHLPEDLAEALGAA
ncbi:MAG: HDOD domain-containing protein [bacterium]|nr:HDOD domain-containing protein [bacterium]